MAVRLWTSYNAAFEIAARCQLLLSKVCSFHVSNSSNFEVTLHTTRYALFSPCLVTIGFSKKENFRDKIHVVFDEKMRLNEMEEHQLDGFAYKIGKDIASRYAILAGSPNHLIFYLDSDYEEFESEYTICYDEKTETFKSDYPLNRYMATEFEAESVLSEDKKIAAPFTILRRNGRDLFSAIRFANKPFSSTITIAKKENKLTVNVKCNGILQDNWLVKINTISKIHSLGEYGFIKSFDYEKGMETCTIYISGDKDSRVRIERIRNYGLKSSDILQAIPLLEQNFNIEHGRDWTTYFDY